VQTGTAIELQDVNDALAKRNHVRVSVALPSRALSPPPLSPPLPLSLSLSCPPRASLRLEVPGPPPSPCANWTRLVLPPVLSGHVSSFPPY
jgi:hypothetical protein